MPPHISQGSLPPPVDREIVPLKTRRLSGSFAFGTTHGETGFVLSATSCFVQKGMCVNNQSLEQRRFKPWTFDPHVKVNDLPPSSP